MNMTESEIIASSILNKIISLSFIKAHCEKIYKNTNDYCYSFLKTHINLLIKGNYIFINENPILKKKKVILLIINIIILGLK